MENNNSSNNGSTTGAPQSAQPYVGGQQPGSSIISTQSSTSK